MTNQLKSADIQEQTLLQLGFETQTEIQKRAIPVLVEGKSLFALAPTGSGKTLAFLIPLMQKIDSEQVGTQLLILAPTRELGAQIAQVAEKVAKILCKPTSRGLTIRSAFGGQKIENQRIEIEKRPHVVVATPGRALDLMNREALSLESLISLVVDEADLMLGMGFEEQIKKICAHLPNKVQTALFSATEAELQTSLQNRLAHRAVRVDVRDEFVIKQGMDDDTGLKKVDLHQYLVVQNQQEKNDKVVEFLKANDHTIASGVIFCQTRDGASTLCEFLRSHGFSTEELSGSLGQIERSTIMRRFKARGVKYLIATNIAARGIDIDRLSIVINYDLPSTPDEYIHRSGRSGRAGKTGWTFSFCMAQAESFFLDIMSKNNLTPKRYHLKAQAAIEKSSPATEVAPAAVRFVKIHLNRGKSSKLRPGDIVGALTQEVGLLGEDVGNIYIFDHFTHVEVNEKKAKTVMKKLATTKIKKLSIRATEAQELTNVRPKGKVSR